MISSQGAYNFAAQPKVVGAKQKFRDPYSGREIEYAPSNIMYDRRIARGSTYASLVMPASNLPLKPKMRETTKRPQEQIKEQVEEQRIATPEPLPGRVNLEVQTETLKEDLTDKPPEGDFGAQTDFYIDRPATPLFRPQKLGQDAATQVDDGELFDFDTEVEPLLEALCSKVLERARMETLEEEELRIIRQQQREFEQVRNAELIEAQQLEAFESRRQAEMERRKLQQRSAKELMYKTHQKVFARVFTKDYLKNMKPSAFGTLISQGILRDPAEKALLGQIIPWIYKNTGEILGEDQDMDQVLKDLIGFAHDEILKEHGDALKKERGKRERKKREDSQKAEENRILQEKLRKEREEQRKRDELIKLQEKVEQQIIAKGEWRNEILKQPVTNLHGNLQGKQTVGVLGGLLGQIGISLTAAAQTLGNEGFVNEKTAYVFLATLLSDELKSEVYELFIGPSLANLVAEKGGKIEELHLLDAEGSQKFIEEYKRQAGGDELLKAFYDNLTNYGISPVLMNYVTDALLKLLLKKLTEKELQGKQGNAKKKIKVVTMPETFKQDPMKPQAIVRVRIPLDRSSDDPDSDEEDKQEKKPEAKKEKVYPEIEYEDKVLAVKPLTEELYTFVIHQAAGRELRNQVCEVLKEHFEKELEGAELEAIQKKAEEIAVAVEQEFLKAFGGVPTFDYEKN